jgi:energy-coupling factor transporter ATP-binding protein EcfA2
MPANMASPEVTLLLVGPTGSGKSAFVKQVAGLGDHDINVGHGPHPCTSTSPYSYQHLHLGS